MPNLPSPEDQSGLAVIIPCLNEESTIAEVVTAFRRELPIARVVVADNDSDDRTAEVAVIAGAEVLVEPERGKGNALRSLLRQIDADLYLMVDGDSTYDPGAAGELLEAAKTLGQGLVLGTRATSDAGAYRRGHLGYNRLLRLLIRVLYGREMNDPLTGYRCLTRRFAESFPARERGFTTEIEMDLYALESGYPVFEVPTHYRARPADSSSKLRAVRDGSRILAVIALQAAGRLRWAYGLLCVVSVAAVLLFDLGSWPTPGFPLSSTILLLISALFGTLAARSLLLRRRWRRQRL